MTHRVRVYNYGFDPDTGVGELLHVVSQRHATGMIHRGVADPVELVERRGEILVTSLALTRMIYAAWIERRQEGTVGFSTREVFERDHWTCAYCGGKVSKTPRRQGMLATVDHVHPRSLGGPTTWWNLVAACSDCNGAKADMLLEQTAMQLRFDPYDPNVAYRDADGTALRYDTGSRAHGPLVAA